MSLLTVITPVLVALPLFAPASALADCSFTHFCVCDFGATTAVMTAYSVIADGGIDLVPTRAADELTVVADTHSHLRGGLE